MIRAIDLALAFAFALSACAANDPDYGPCTASIDVKTEILQHRCGAVGCHNPESPAAHLDLVSPGVEARLRDHAGNRCSGKLIDPGDPAHSLILEKVGSHPPCGATMPLAGTPLTKDQKACLAAWIDDAAAP